jgi:hypothetical protein
MTKSRKICLAALLLSVPLFWAVVLQLAITEWKL